jgi:hypothetical protein
LTSRTETQRFGKEKVKVPPVPAVKVCVVVFTTSLPIALLLIPDGAVRTVRTAIAPSPTAAKVIAIGRSPLPLYTAVLRICKPVLELIPATQ